MYSYYIAIDITLVTHRHNLQSNFRKFSCHYYNNNFIFKFLKIPNSYRDSLTKIQTYQFYHTVILSRFTNITIH